MKHQIIIFFSLLLVLNSCKDKSTKRQAESIKETEKENRIYKNIHENWIFYDTPINTTAEATVVSWVEFRQFLAELAKKPQKTIRGFQKQADEISKRALVLNTTIPLQFDKPQIKCRINALITKVSLLDLFINQKNISDKKIIRLIGETNLELISLQRQMDKIIEKSKITIEEGEFEMLQLRDTTRAIPNTTIDPNLHHVEQNRLYPLR